MLAPKERECRLISLKMKFSRANCTNMIYSGYWCSDPPLDIADVGKGAGRNKALFLTEFVGNMQHVKSKATYNTWRPTLLKANAII